MSFIRVEDDSTIKLVTDSFFYLLPHEDDGVIPILD